MKFLVPNYSCLQNLWLGGYRPQIPILSSTEFIEPSPWKKFLGTPLYLYYAFCKLNTLSTMQKGDNIHILQINDKSELLNMAQ